MKTTLLPSILTTLLLFFCASTAWADPPPLEGHIVDAITGLPVPNALVQVLQTGQEMRTDQEGAYSFELPEGMYSLLIKGPPTIGIRPTQGLVVRQRVDSDASWPTTTHIQGLNWHLNHPSVAQPQGLPSTSGHIPHDTGQLRLRDYWARRMGIPVEELESLKLSMPQELPAMVRVGRRFSGTCRNNPVTRIDNVPLEEYVQGVLIPEIGIFRSAATGRESSREVFKAFAIAARTYALYFIIGGFNNERGYDLDDTACNQRYTDDRDSWVQELVAETSGQVLVQEGTTDVFDKFEYAASCGRHSCWPEYASRGDYVSDAGLTRVCVGNWCGHNNCAAHEDNPNLPGDDRCLVRGLCQWGALERSAGNQNHLDILSHYQPHLDIRGMDVEPQGGQIKGFVRTGASFEDGAALSGATVAIDTGQAVIINVTGYFEFTNIEAGFHRMTISAPGYQQDMRQFNVIEGEDTWLSILLEEASANNNDNNTNPPDMGSPDFGSTDMGNPEDLREEDLAPPVDMGNPAPDLNQDRPDTNFNEDDAEPDKTFEPDTNPTSSDSFTLFSTVPQGGLNNDGCGCHQSPGAPAKHGLWVCLLAFVALLGQRRSKKH